MNRKVDEQGLGMQTGEPIDFSCISISMTFYPAVCYCCYNLMIFYDWRECKMKVLSQCNCIDTKK